MGPLLSGHSVRYGKGHSGAQGPTGPDLPPSELLKMKQGLQATDAGGESMLSNLKRAEEHTRMAFSGE